MGYDSQFREEDILGRECPVCKKGPVFEGPRKEFTEGLGEDFYICDNCGILFGEFDVRFISSKVT